MQYFTSSVSDKKFPLKEKIAGKSLRNGLLKEIQKEFPEFNDDSVLAVSELYEYRKKYVQNLLNKEVGSITDLEQTVLDTINQNHLISDEASEVKNPVTRGQLWADRIASFGGSWKFIGLFALFLLIWMLVNAAYLHDKGFDPYPFILLNLILSCIAAIQAPVIMMSQNRQEEKDRDRARNDYMVNLKSEIEIRILHEKMDHLIITQQENLLEIQQAQMDMMSQLLSTMNRK
jgi:uncharacterized membrane protein